MFNKIKNEIKTEVTTMNIGNNIAVLRKKKGITQEELANELGVSAQAVSKWENNSSCPDVSLLTKIADYFGVSVDALLRAQEDDIVDLAEEKEDNVKPDDKKNIVIKIMQQNGKENVIKVPFKFVKLGLNIGTMFGLDKDISSKIVTLAESNVTDIVNIDTENGEHIEIMLD
jgi:transcriptional regulator with XRE-family HTH domain